MIATGVEVLGKHPRQSEVLTEEALEFVSLLQRKFGLRREELLRERAARQARLDAGEMPDFLPETKRVRESDWTVAPAPADLQNRRVEITGPVDRKMMINALNSGANLFMADLEDSLSPTWSNVIEGQLNLYDAVRHELALDDPHSGKSYRLKDQTATLVVRPRGWHLVDKHLKIDGNYVSASFLDFGLYFFHNAREAVQRGSGPYFYLPKLQGHYEAKLWNDVFVAAQEYLELPRGTIRATVLIEHILAAFEMDEILFELKEHASGHNAGRWDYIFSLIKSFSTRPEMVLPDRAQVQMTVPFMRAYADLLVKTCHRRGAHAIGGMAAFIPSRRDASINEVALQKVAEDKRREAKQGFDGTWIAHPDLVPVAHSAFEEVLGGEVDQKHNLREDVSVGGQELVDTRISGGEITEAGMRNNVSVALQYIAAWLGGNGAVAIFNLMEDAATAEISRAQLWQWIRNRVELSDGREVTKDLYVRVRDEELAKLGDAPTLQEASKILDTLVLSDEFVEFLTLPSYQVLA